MIFLNWRVDVVEVEMFVSFFQNFQNKYDYVDLEVVGDFFTTPHTARFFPFSCESWALIVLLHKKSSVIIKVCRLFLCFWISRWFQIWKALCFVQKQSENVLRVCSILFAKAWNFLVTTSRFCLKLEVFLLESWLPISFDNNSATTLSGITTKKENLGNFYKFVQPVYNRRPWSTKSR